MTKTILTGLLIAAFAAPALAADAKPNTPQQQRMKDCNASATSQSLKGDARKQFMKSCLSGESAGAVTSKQAAQREKMKTCNAEATAKSLKGADRKQFMSTCLSH